MRVQYSCETVKLDLMSVAHEPICSDDAVNLGNIRCVKVNMTCILVEKFLLTIIALVQDKQEIFSMNIVFRLINFETPNFRQREYVESFEFELSLFHV